MAKKIIAVDIFRTPQLPFELLYALSAVKERVRPEDVTVYHVNRYSDSRPVVEAVRACREEAVLFIWMYEQFVPLELQQLARELLQVGSEKDGITVVMGGLQPTMVKELLVREKRLDYIIAGWPWGVSDEWLTGGSNEEPRILASTEAGLSDDVRIQDFFHRIVDTGQCLKHNESGDGFFSYKTEYLCKNGCAFCHTSHFLKRYGGMFAKSEAQVADELAFLKTELGVSRAYVNNNTCNLDTIRLIENAGFKLEDQFDLMVKDTTPELLGKFRDLGAWCVFIGLESLQASVQEKVGKSYDLEHLESILEYGDSIGMMFEGNALVGLSSILGEPASADDIKRDIKAVVPFIRKHPNLRVLLQAYMPLLGTPLGDKLWRKSGRLGDMGFWDYVRLGFLVADGQGVPDDLPVPPTYADREAVDVTRFYANSFRQMVRHKTSLYRFPPKNPDKARMCELLTGICCDILEKDEVDFADFMEGALDALSRWR